jgi:hypothetical protein
LLTVDRVIDLVEATANLFNIGHLLVTLVAGLGIGAIVAAFITLYGNALAQRRRESREDAGVRIQLRAMLHDLSIVVQYAYEHGIFLKATWNTRLNRLVLKLQERATAPALYPSTYSRLLFAVSQAEHFAATMEDPQMQVESAEEIRRLFSLRRKWRSDDELNEIADRRQQVAVVRWVEWTRTSIDAARTALQDEITSREGGFFKRRIRKIMKALKNVRYTWIAWRSGLIVARSLSDEDLRSQTRYRG